MKPHSADDWLEYNAWNKRDERITDLWTRSLITWLKEHANLSPKTRVLDYGCGYFDAGIALIHSAEQVDGYDPDPDALAAARRRTAGQSKTRIYGHDAELPRGFYDLIVINSVLQYLDDESALRKALALLHALLKSEPGATVILSDVILPNYVPAYDALRSLLFATRHGAFVPMLIHLYKAAVKPSDLKLLRIAPEHLASLATETGFTYEQLPTNLTPSAGRYSCRLTRR